MKQIQEYENKLGLSEIALVEDALKFYFENAVKQTQEKITWANTYKKVVLLKDQAIEDYRNRDNK